MAVPIAHAAHWALYALYAVPVLVVTFSIVTTLARERRGRRADTGAGDRERR